MSKSLKRHRTAEEDCSDHKIKVLKKKESDALFTDFSEDYADDEVVCKYFDDPKLYRAIKEFR